MGAGLGPLAVSAGLGVGGVVALDALLQGNIALALVHDDVDLGILLVLIGGAVLVHLVALGGLNLLEVVDGVLHEGVEDLQIALGGLQDGLHLGEIEVAILVAGAVHLHGDFFLGFLVDDPVLNGPQLELGLAVGDGLGLLNGVAVLVGDDVAVLVNLVNHLHLAQLEVAVGLLQLDGVVPGPLGVLPVITGQLAVDVQSHHEGGPGGLVGLQAALQQLLEIAVGLLPDLLMGHVVIQRVLEAIVGPGVVVILKPAVGHLLKVAEDFVDIRRIPIGEGEQMFVEIVVLGLFSGCIFERLTVISPRLTNPLIA